MAIKASQVKELREKTGAGMMDCKKALTETDGDIAAAIDWLREKGIAKSQKKAGRIAAEGLTRVATEGNTGIIFEVNSETDFVAKNEQFLHLLDVIEKALLAAKPANTEAALEERGEAGSSMCRKGGMPGGAGTRGVARRMAGVCGKRAVRFPRPPTAWRDGAGEERVAARSSHRGVCINTCWLISDCAFRWILCRPVKVNSSNPLLYSGGDEKFALSNIVGSIP